MLNKNVVFGGAMLVVLGIAGAVYGQATMVDRAVVQLRQSAPVSREAFDFVVIGDTRSSRPVVLPEKFKRAIREFNVLKPAFVIDTGDLILGGAAEGLDPQWDEFERVVGQCQVPFFPVVGNHDVSDAATERIYLERIGALCYAFSYGNSRFIALNTEEVGALEMMSEDQVSWLTKELESTDAAHIFLFMHKPYFARKGEYGEGNGGWWRTVAPVLRGHPVRVVFASHWHYYLDCGDMDGVRYVISGGGGASLHAPSEEGGFHHYLLVRVRGENVSWAVVEPGSILPEDVITSARVDEIHAAKNGARSETIEVAYGQGFDREVTVSIANPYPTSFDSLLAWTVPEGWTVAPAEMTYTVKGSATTHLTFHIRADGPDQVRFPVPTFRTVFKNAQHGGPIEVSKRLDLVPTTRASRALGAAVIDGELDEWGVAQPLRLTYPWSFDINDTDDLEAQCRLMWDDGHVYLAVECDDDEFYQPYAGDIVWSADNVQLFLDQWEWGLSLTQAGPEVFLYVGPGRSSETVNKVVQLAVKRNGRRTTYEAAFPASEVAPLELRAGASYTLSVVMNDLDPSHPDRPRHWAELTPGAGSGTEGFPMVKVELAE